jgi:hypothetical protein
MIVRIVGDRHVGALTYARVVDERDIAYIYPAPYWSLDESDWVKSLLLFFDGVAILLPDYMYGRHQRSDPSLVLPLEEQGLLRVLEPRTWIDEPARVELAATMGALADSGAFDALDKSVYFQELSSSRAGYNVDVSVAEDLVERLFKLGLARPTEDGVSIPMHPTVRTTMLVLLGQLSRGVGQRGGETVHPATSNATAVGDLRQFLLSGPLDTSPGVVDLDLEHVGLNVGPVPLDDILAFRAEHLDEHKAYTRRLRQFLGELSATVDAESRVDLLIERREELADEARRLQKQARTSIHANLGSFGLGIAGAVWSMTGNDAIGALLGVGSLAVGLGTLRSSDTVGAYSYLFSASNQFRG